MVPAAVLTIFSAPIVLSYWLKLELHWKILIAMLSAGILGVVTLNYLPFMKDLGFLYPLGTLFINLLKMVIVPLILTSIISGVASIGDPRSLGRMGIKTISYYLLTSLCAIMIGLVLMNLIHPGTGAQLAASAPAVDPDTLEKPGSVWEILIRMVPSNPVRAAVEGDMLGLIFFAIALGFAITTLSDSIKGTLVPIVDAGFQAMMRLTELIIQIAPIGVFGLILKAVSALDFGLMKSLGLYAFTIFLGLSLHLFVVLPLLIHFFGKRSPFSHFMHMKNAMVTAFSTSSSSATLPVTMECIEKNAGVSNKVSSFVLPMGATINMDGTALYECAGVLFIAQVLGVHLSLGQQMVVVVTALLASIGAAGIPSAGLVMIFIVLKAVGLEGPEVNGLVGIMLAIDRPLDMYRTVVNITSDSVGALAVARSEGELSESVEFG
ncbi:MAG: dicarboxylate/amino acid:cation symporter [Acidobacteria bacterium]|nr:dicarboxylate/amino acid:cation symporter [Acidobacteriota bacterium]MCB9397897.1 dicarboxylate/amino acid:cation symporter [Acidobacteriota bacterium]